MRVFLMAAVMAAALMSFADKADANPDIEITHMCLFEDGSWQVCYVVRSPYHPYTGEQWLGANPDIHVEIQIGKTSLANGVPDPVNATTLPGGAFTHENGLQFTGCVTIPAEEDRLIICAIALAKWENGADPGGWDCEIVKPGYALEKPTELCDEEPPPPPTGEDCCNSDNKPVVLTMQYNGEDCDQSSNSQNPDKTDCNGDPNFDPEVYIIVSSKGNPDDKKAKTWFAGTVALDAYFEIDAGNAGADRLSGDTHYFIYSDDSRDTLLQSGKFHTSCSQPLITGDQFGSLVLIDCVGDGETGGGGGDGSSLCSSDLKPAILEMEYTGQDCDASSHTQASDKVACEGDPAFDPSVYIIARNKEKADDKKAKTWFEGTVSLGGTFAISNGGNKLEGAETFFFIYSDDSMGTLLQYGKFHTSCSQPLNIGDQFGALKLVGFTGVPK